MLKATRTRETNKEFYVDREFYKKISKIGDELGHDGPAYQGLLKSFVWITPLRLLYPRYLYIRKTYGAEKATHFYESVLEYFRDLESDFIHAESKSDSDFQKRF